MQMSKASVEEDCEKTLSSSSSASSSPPSSFRNSYQQRSPRSSFGSSTRGRRRSSTRLSGFLHHMIRFSIEGGYEHPPGEDFAGSDSDDDDDHERGYPPSVLRKKYRVCRKGPLVATSSLFLGALVVYAVLKSVKVRIPLPSRRHSDHPVYTGDETSTTCDKDELSMESLRPFASQEDIEHGAVAADHPKCSEIGLSILRDLNGNAVDAAVATALCLGVANPSSSGIGGGAFILIHAEPSSTKQEEWPKFHDARNNKTSLVDEKSGKITEVIDCREVAGQAASTYMYEEDDVPSDTSLYGGLAVAVPGELRGLELAHARHGRLDWATVVRPAMELARDGVPVYTHLAHDIKYFQTKQKEHGGLPTLRRLLTHNDDWKNILQQGELLHNAKLAETLDAVMKDGADAMYTGQRAKQLASEIQNAGGILTPEDLEQYYPTLRSPVVSDNIFGFKVVGVPPPSSGGAVIIGALRFLKGYAEPLASFADTLSIHRMVEALKHVFSIRMSLADPAFPLVNDANNATTQDAVDALVQGTYMEELRQSTFDHTTLNLSHYGGPRFAQLHDTDGQAKGKDAKEGDRRRLSEESSTRRRRLYDPFGYLEDHGTSHFSVVDKDGNVVAMTTSVNSQFGCGLVSESTGILLNNQMDDFSNPGKANYFGLKPAEANYIKPGKKPLSSMSPTLIFQQKGTQQGTDRDEGLGKLRLALGGSGGPKIITAVFQVIINHLLLGKPLFESVSHPRIHNQLIYHGAAATEVENSFVHPSEINLLVSNRTMTALQNRDQDLVEIDYAGTVQAVGVDPETGRMTAVCDIRKGGSPIGY